MNIYQKLSKARVELQNLKLKKSGKNQNIEYFRLEDFLPAINKLAEKYEFFTRTNIVTDNGTEKAVLTIYNAAEPSEKIDFVMPTAEAGLPRGQAIQNLGAKISYMRRYMLLTAFEIVEPEYVDSINMELNDTMTQEDINKVNEAKTLKDLTALFLELGNKYKKSIMTPAFAQKRVELEQEESKA